MLSTLYYKNVIYKVTYSGCNEDYVRKTDLNLITRLSEPGSRADQPMYQHLVKCEQFAHIVDFLKLPEIEA